MIYIYLVCLNVRGLLLPVLFGTNVIHIADGFERGCTDPDDSLYTVSIAYAFYGFYTAEFSLNTV
jgi:hypothetical protein